MGFLKVGAFGVSRISQTAIPYPNQPSFPLIQNAGRLAADHNPFAFMPNQSPRRRVDAPNAFYFSPDLAHLTRRCPLRVSAF